MSVNIPLTPRDRIGWKVRFRSRADVASGVNRTKNSRRVSSSGSIRRNVLGDERSGRDNRFLTRDHATDIAHVPPDRRIAKRQPAEIGGNSDRSFDVANITADSGVLPRTPFVICRGPGRGRKRVPRVTAVPEFATDNRAAYSRNAQCPDFGKTGNSKRFSTQPCRFLRRLAFQDALDRTSGAIRVKRSHRCASESCAHGAGQIDAADRC